MKKTTTELIIIMMMIIIIVIIIMIIIIIIIIIVITIIIALKGAIRNFLVSSLRREPSPTRTLKWPVRDRVQITCNTSSAYHVQHVVFRARCYEGIAQLLSMT